jgi:CRISPR-associated protein Cas5t
MSVSTHAPPHRDVVSVYVSVPVTSFRLPHAREYLETSAAPPPSTVYGMLLSMVGEPNRLVHAGAELAIVLLSDPQRSTVLRTAWRVKSLKEPPGLGGNKRPDFQELLTDVRLAVFVRRGAQESTAWSLADRVRGALNDPASIRRFGGLSLGESTHLVDEVRPIRSGDAERGRLLVSDPAGDLPLPLWPDHVGSAGTRWGQFRIVDLPADALQSPGLLPEAAWVTIPPP